MAKKKEQSFDDILEQLQHRNPFSPFKIIMAGGEEILISDPFGMVIAAVEVFYAKPKSGIVHRLRKSQISSIEEHHDKAVA